MIEKLLPTAVLVIVASAQIVLAHTIALTPWKGGGFGMFSTLDAASDRGVDVTIEAPNRSEEQEIPPSLEDDAARAAACPTDWLLLRLAEGIVERERRYGRDVTRVTLSVWRIEVDRSTLATTEQSLRTFVHNVPNPLAMNKLPMH